jgi:hypothetical protein
MRYISDSEPNSLSNPNKSKKMGEPNEVPQGLTLAVVGAGKSSEATKNEDYS